MKKAFYAITMMASVALISCGGKMGGEGKDGAQGSATSGNVYSYDHPGLVHDQEAINKAFEELKNLDKFKGKKIMVFHNIRFQDYGIELDICDPAKETNVDHYEYKEGNWSAPEPVQFHESEAEMKEGMKDNVTDLDRIPYNKIGDMVKIVDEKAKTIEGAKPCTYIYFNLIVHNQRREFSASVEGTRQSESFDFNMDGTLQKD